MSNSNEMSIRIFGADGCIHCKKIMEEFSLMGVPYSFVDANADDNQSLCDKYGVDSLPHVQCVSKKNNEVIFQNAGPISAQTFMNKVAEKVSGKKGATFKGKSDCKNCDRK